MAMPLNYGSGGGRDQRGAGRIGVGPGSLGHAPRGGGKRGLMGLFPSTSISQQTLNQLLSGARTQVQANYAPSALPSQQSYLQPYEDRRAQNKSLADAAAGYLQGASTNAQTLSGNLIGGLTGAIQGGAQATVAAGGSGLPGAIPTAAQATAGAQQIGSTWANYLNALIPAQAAAAQEADAGVTRDENSAIAEYHKAQGQRTTDMQGAIQALYKGNLDTLKSAKDSDYRNAITLYTVLGRQKYEKLRLQQQSHEFGVNTDLKKRRLDQTDTTIGQTDRRLNLEARRVNAQVKKWADSSAAKGVTIPDSVLRMLQGSSHYKTASNDYQVQKVLLTPDAAGHPAGTLYGNPSYVPRGPLQGAPQTDAQGYLIDASGKRTGYKLISRTPRVTQGKDKVYVPLTGAQWDAAAAALGLKTGKGPAWARQYLTTYTPRPQGS